MPTRKDVTTRQPLACGPGCPGRGSALTAEQLQSAYLQHQAELEAQLDHQLAARKRYNAGRRPDWWWRFHEDATAWRSDPSRFQQPTDTRPHPVNVEQPTWMAESFTRRDVENLGKLRFLARLGLLVDWEVQHILTRGASTAAGPYFALEVRVVREELARKVPV